MNPAANHCPLPKFALWGLALDSVSQMFRPFCPLFPRNPLFPALRFGHRLFQRPSPGKQFPSINHRSIMTLLPKKDFSLASLTILAAILFSGCGIPTRQILPVATGDTPPSGKCLIIVQSTSMGPLAYNEIYDNKTHVGTLTSDGKLAWLREPGPLELKAEMNMGRPTRLRRLNVEAGKTYLYTGSLSGPGKDGSEPLTESEIRMVYAKLSDRAKADFNKISPEGKDGLARLGKELIEVFSSANDATLTLPGGKVLKKTNGVFTESWGYFNHIN